MKKLIAVFILLLVIKCIHAQPKKFDNILYGVAYYHEYMPYERLDKDIEMMKDAGISVVRLGESSWVCLNHRKVILNLPGWIASLIKCTKQELK
jgi:hypothetical protein